jgi:hypothetical protein
MLQISSMRKWKHPSTQTRSTYTSWVNMRLRCSNPNHPLWQHYGGRGIRVCDEWNMSYDEFYEAMGDRPEGYTIDRIDNDRGYEPGNCRWVSMAVQNRNNRRTHLISHKGETLPLVDWAKRYGFTPTGMRARLKKLPREIALSSENQRPIKKHGTLTMYVADKCRCEICRKAYSDYQKARRK